MVKFVDKDQKLSPTILCHEFNTKIYKDIPQEKLVIVRSAVPTRDMGFLPGTLEEKEDAYKAPYYSILSQLFGDSDAWKKIEAAKQIEFLTTSFIFFPKQTTETLLCAKSFLISTLTRLMMLLLNPPQSPRLDVMATINTRS